MIMRKRDDKYWQRAQFEFHDPRPPVPFYRYMPWWIWPFSLGTLAAAGYMGYLIARSF